jgi:hypothetical protein
VRALLAAHARRPMTPSTALFLATPAALLALVRRPRPARAAAHPPIVLSRAVFFLSPSLAPDIRLASNLRFPPARAPALRRAGPHRFSRTGRSTCSTATGTARRARTPRPRCRLGAASRSTSTPGGTTGRTTPGAVPLF